MRPAGIKFYFALLACATLATFLQGCEKKEAGGFKETRVAVKTSLPPGTDLAQSRTLSFADFISIPDPPGLQKNDPRYDKVRIPPFANPLGVKEGDVVRVGGYLQLVTYMGDGDYNLRFTGTEDSPDHYVIVEIPDDDDLADKKLRPLVIAARNALKAQALEGKDPSRQGTKIAASPYVEITGQLYFSDNHVGDAPAPDRQGLHRASNWQIHPGLFINFAAKPSL
jgi:hypothetical protein